MESAFDKKLEELFRLAIELDPEERTGFFQRHCPDDALLRKELESLLEEDDEGTKSFLKSPVNGDRHPTTSSAGDGGDPAEVERAYRIRSGGTRIGRYRLIEKVGEGGMGSVYLAEQEFPVRREVAIKIVKLGMDTKRVVARFEAERQALALMSHPGIARIFDGGATSNGRPYYAMEYVPGPSIRDYCDGEKLGSQERLRLFERVCAAAQHAHQKGIIHRDLKPTNVLVHTEGDDVVPKIIDFGIARSISRSMHEISANTVESEVVGTSFYMSPEQAVPGESDIDTRSDIYSLGILLYELLTGHLPFDCDNPKKLSLAQIQAIIRDEFPIAPSVRVSNLGPTARGVAEKRGTDSVSLVRSLEGDLDWILLKALEKDPSERYDSVSELAADIRRHRRHEPLLAGPPNLKYRTTKFVRRNRIGVLVGTVVVVAIVAGLGGLLWGKLEADRKAAEATESAKKAMQAETLSRERQATADLLRASEQEQRQKAELENKQAQALTRFLVETLAEANPEVSLDPNKTLDSILYRIEELVDQEFQVSPEGEATLRLAMGEAFHSIGKLPLAETHLRTALEILMKLESAPREELYRTVNRLAQVYEDSGSQDSFELRQRAAELGLDILAPAMPALAADLAGLLESVGEVRVDKALEHLGALADGANRVLDDGDPAWLLLADLYDFVGHHLGYTWGESEAGERFANESLRIRRLELPDSHPDIGRGLRQEVLMLNAQERYAQAEPLAREAVEIFENAFGAGHWLASAARSQLGECLSGQKLNEEAEVLLMSSHQAIFAERGYASSASRNASYRLVSHFDRSNQQVKSERYRSVLAESFAFSKNLSRRWGQQGAAFDERYATLSDALYKLDELIAKSTIEGHDGEVLPGVANALHQVIVLRRSLLPDDHLLSVLVARQLDEWASLDTAEDSTLQRELRTEVLRVLEPYRRPLPIPVAEAYASLAEADLDDGNPARAEERLREACELYGEAIGPQSRQVLHCQSRLAVAILHQKRPFEAEALQREAWNDCILTLGEAHELTGQALRHLINLYELQGTPEKASSFLETHLRGRLGGPTDPGWLRTLSWFVVRHPVFDPDLNALAVRASRRALEEAPDDGLAASVFGAALYRAGRYSEALDAFLVAMWVNHGVEPIDWAFLAMTLQMTGRQEEAQAALRQMLTIVQDSQDDPRNQRLVREATLAVKSD